MFKSPTSVQLVPFHDSFIACVAKPPIANADVVVPAPPKSCLPVFKSASSVHADPFQDSVTANVLGGFPPKPKAAVPAKPAPPQ